MTKRTARAQRTQGKNGAGPAPGHLVEPMLAGMTTTRQHLLAWVHAHGLAALDASGSSIPSCRRNAAMARNCSQRTVPSSLHITSAASRAEPASVGRQRVPPALAPGEGPTRPPT